MDLERIENKSRPERLVIPPDWQIQPVQPPSKSIFQPVELITPEEVEMALELEGYRREIEISTIEELSYLGDFLARYSRGFICNSSPSLVTEKGESKIGHLLSLEALIKARETNIVFCQDNTAYRCSRKQSENERIIMECLTINSFISRLLIVTKQEDGIKFLCRPRGEESTLYKGFLDIAGGKLKRTEEAEEDLNNPPIVSTARALTETFSSGATREYLEEFGSLIPAVQFRAGSFITFITNGKDSSFEVTELATVSPLDLEALKMLGNYRQSQRASLGNEWQIEDIDSVLQKDGPILPTLYAILSRFKGQYIYEYMGWQIYGEYIPYYQTYFETRGKEIKI